MSYVPDKNCPARHQPPACPSARSPAHHGLDNTPCSQRLRGKKAQINRSCVLPMGVQVFNGPNICGDLFFSIVCVGITKG